jgi:hypothetical protein
MPGQLPEWSWPWLPPWLWLEPGAWPCPSSCPGSVVPLFGVVVVVDGVVVVVVDELELAAYAAVPPPIAPATVKATSAVRMRVPTLVTSFPPMC